VVERDRGPKLPALRAERVQNVDQVDRDVRAFAADRRDVRMPGSSWNLGGDPR